MTMRYFFLFIVISGSLFSCKSPFSETNYAGHKQEKQNDAIALSQQVIIRRTDHGIPHVDAQNVEAAGYALGYLQMEDHADRVVERLLKARGEWAKYNEFDTSKRSEAIDDDAANRLKYNRAVETWQLLENDTQDFISGFTKGLNRYIELNNNEFTQWPNLHFTVYDVHARNIVAPRNRSIQRFLRAHEQEYENNKELSVWARRAAREKAPNPDVGSNVWAFGPERTVSGNAILMRNPHLSWDAGYYEAHINVPGKFNFYGDFRVGQALGIIGGFNQRLGWSTTNNYPDLDEVYAFTADPKKADHYILDDASISLNKQVISIQYKFGDGIGTQTREFWSTEHGPIILREAGKIYVMKSAGDGEFRTGEQFFKMMMAQNLQEWKAAMQIRARISSNFTYADADGNIFYVWNANMPERPHPTGEDTLAFHVSSSKQMWQSYTDWEKLPQLENPKGGYLRNENDTYHFTNLNEVLLPEKFLSFYPQPKLGLRSQHSIKLVHNDKKFSLSDIIEMKHSEGMLLADRVKQDLITAVEERQPSSEVLDAIQLLKQWDNTVSKDSRGGVLFETWWNQYVALADADSVNSSAESVGYSASAYKLFKQPWSYNKPTTTPYGLADFKRAAETFKWAVTETTQKYGHWSVAWGEVHRAVIGDLDLPVAGCTGLLGCYRVLWYTEHKQSARQRSVTGGDGWVLAVEFGETPKAYSVLAYGQSEKLNSPYYNDQLLHFTNNVMTPVFFSEEDIKENVVREYRPGGTSQASY